MGVTVEMIEHGWFYQYFWRLAAGETYQSQNEAR
jgi:hypothetical protein